MGGIEFSRKVCSRDPEFVVVHIRMPMQGESLFMGEYTGAEAQIKATKFFFGTVHGLLHVCGLVDAAAKFARLSAIILSAVECTEVTRSESQRSRMH